MTYWKSDAHPFLLPAWTTMQSHTRSRHRRGSVRINQARQAEAHRARQYPCWA